MWFWTIKTRARLNPKGMPKIVKPFVTTNFVTLIGRRTGKHGDVFSVMLGAYEKHTDGARCKQSEAYFLRSQEDVWGPRCRAGSRRSRWLVSRSLCRVVRRAARGSGLGAAAPIRVCSAPILPAAEVLPCSKRNS